ncbi:MULTISPECIES: hypothetical protein [Streptomyces violaceusniger group]|nr:hypothetical protein [Streptomyces rhizosphaericus]
MIRTYLVEHEVWSTSAAAARADLVGSLLSDAAAMDVDEASRALGYNLRRTHEAVVVWSDSPKGGPALQAAKIEVLRARGATTTPVTVRPRRRRPADRAGHQGRRVDDGRLRLHIAARRPVAESSAVHEDAAAGRLPGKTVLTAP